MNHLKTNVKNNRTTYIVDGYGFVFRAYYSMPPLTSPTGVPVGAVYGFINMMMKLLEQHKNDNVIIVLDSGNKNFRHTIYPEYKANRSEAPEDLKIQFPIIREAIAALNLTVFELENFEADDVIASIAKQLSLAQVVKIISSDKDLMQLMSQNIRFYDPVKQKEIDEACVKEKFGVQPEKIIDILSLVGDAADNIPGVMGIGIKTAIKLLNQFKSIEDIYKNIETIEPQRIQALLRKNHANALLSKQLLALVEDLKIPLQDSMLSQKTIDYTQLMVFLNKYGFKSLIQKFKLMKDYVEEIVILPNIQNNIILEEYNYKSLDELNIKQFISYATTEGVMVVYQEKEEILIVVKQQLYKMNYDDNLLILIKEVWEGVWVKKICFLYKDFIRRLINLGITPSAFEDIAVLAYTLDMGRYKMDFKNILQFALNKFSDHEINQPYKALLILPIYLSLKTRLLREKKYTLYEEIDKPLITQLAIMECNGVKIDEKILSTLSQNFQSLLQKLELRIYDICGETFNISSTKQLGKILFENLKLPYGKKSKKSGNYTTDVEILDRLSEEGYEIGRLLLEWRHLSKLITTYTESLPKFINNVSGRVHTTFEATLTSTGRLSSKNPNLQNIPIKTLEGNQIRKAFVAEENSMIISADYSQIELRVLAEMAGIDSLKEAFQQNQDIHTVTASQIFKIPLINVTQDIRRRAKEINFGIIYGISAYGLAKNLDIPKNIAALYIEDYFRQYPGIKKYMEETINFAKQNGYVKTMFGRKCYIQDIENPNYLLRSFAERTH